MSSYIVQQFEVYPTVLERPHLAGHAEIAQLAVPVPVQQKIAALDVSMDQLLTVQVLQRLCSL